MFGMNVMMAYNFELKMIFYYGEFQKKKLYVWI